MSIVLPAHPLKKSTLLHLYKIIKILFLNNEYSHVFLSKMSIFSKHYP